MTLRKEAVVAMIVTLAVSSGAGQSRRPTATVTFPGGIRVHAEIADTPDARARGLMFRKALGPTEGMLFVFPETGFYPFWMKNTLVPLDILWVSEDWRIVSIAESVPPCREDPCPSYPPRAQARYVVEVAGGFVRSHGVARGDRLVVTGFTPKPDVR